MWEVSDSGKVSDVAARIDQKFPEKGTYTEHQAAGKALRDLLSASKPEQQCMYHAIGHRLGTEKTGFDGFNVSLVFTANPTGI